MINADDLDDSDDGFNLEEDNGIGLGLDNYEDYKHNHNQISLSQFIRDNPIPNTNRTLEEIFAAELDKPDVDYIRNNPPLKPPKSRPIELKNTVEPTIHYAEVVKLSFDEFKQINEEKKHNNPSYVNLPSLRDEIKDDINKRDISKEEKSKLLSTWCSTSKGKYKKRNELLEYKSVDGKPILNRMWDKIKSITPKKKKQKNRIESGKDEKKKKK